MNPDIDKFVRHPLNGKIPILPEWQKLTKTPDNMQEYIAKGFNQGAVCGKASGFTAIDLDHEIFVDDIFNGFDLNTLKSARTQGRGHVYFKYCPSLPASKHHDLGIEILSDGSNVVIPPSIHPSGDIYKWNDPDAPIIEMPEKLISNLKILFTTEAELKQLIAKCRHCIRDVLKKHPDMHGAEGREYMLAVCTDLKAAGALESHIRMFAKLMYGKDFDETRTLQEWRNIDASKTWKCETLRSKLASYIASNECGKCDRRRDNYKGNANTPIEKTKKEYKTNGAFDYIDRIFEKTPIYFDTSQQFYIWEKPGYYKQIDQTEILLTLLQDIADPSIIQKTFKGELLEAARLRGRDARVKPVPRNWIHVKNGVYDIGNGEMHEATPEYLFTDPIPHKISGLEDTPTIDKLFSEWVEPAKIPLLYEIAAYCLYNGYPIHRMFVLIGRGRNGKGQFRDLIVNLVGAQNRSASTLEQLINSRFETARLFNKKICTMGEINYTLLDRTAILKMLSGGDPIPGEMKNKSPFEFVNTAKLLINTNSLPQTSDKTDAFYSRCIIVEFGRQFPLGKDIIDTIPEAEYDNLLTKCLRILRELLDRGEFTNEGNIQDKEREFERLSNPLTQFINTYYEPDVNSKVAAWQLMDDYVAYCIEKGFKKPHSKNEFNNMLKINYEVEKKSLIDEADGINKCWVWVFGIKPKLSKLSKLSEFPLNTPYGESYEILDKTDKTDNSSLPIVKKNQSKDSILESPKTDKKDTFISTGNEHPIKTVTEFQDFGQRAKDWEVMHSKSITNETKIEASLWIVQSLKKLDVKPSEVMRYLEKSYGLTPEAIS